MGGGDELLGVSADAIFKASAERVLGVGKDSAGRGNSAFSVFQSTCPVGAACALHFVLLRNRNCWTQVTRTKGFLRGRGAGSLSSRKLPSRSSDTTGLSLNRQ